MISGDRFYPPHLGNVVLEVALDANLQRDRTGRAPDASPMQTYLHRPVLGECHKLDVTPVGLNRRPDQVQNVLHSICHGGLRCLPVAHEAQLYGGRSAAGPSPSAV